MTGATLPAGPSRSLVPADDPRLTIPVQDASPQFGADDEMAAHPVLPLHLSLTGRPVVVVGGGAVGARKVASCLRSGAQVTLVSPWACPDLRDRAAARELTWIVRPYRPGDLVGAWLAFAATTDEQVNAAIATEAEHRRVFCVRADEASRGSARSPAVVVRDEVVVGVSTVGPDADPGRTRQIRDLLAAALAQGLAAVPRQRGRD